ncbi:MAG: dockerin type I domain-containing protein [Hespellia sp.]|nr:dockerin type I domain-containing protein [Hespellia sp.]
MKKFFKRGLCAVLVLTMMCSQSVLATDVAAEESEANEASQEIQTYAYDTTKPVINSVSMVESGQTLKVGDVVHIQVDAYDADSDIKSVEIALSSDKGSKSMQADKQDGDTTLYECEYTIEKSDAGSKYQLTSVAVKDIAGNTEDGTTYLWNENNGWNYTFSVEDVVEDEKPVVSDINIDTTSEIVHKNEIINISALITGAKAATNARFVFYPVDTPIDSYSQYEVSLSAHRDEDGSDRFSGVGDVAYMPSSDYYLAKIEIDNVSVDLPDNYKEIGFTYENKGYGVDIPQITSIDLQENRQTLTVGDTVHVSVGVQDEGGLYDYGNIVFTSDQSAGTRVWIDLQYNEETKKYEGSYTIQEDTYPCEYYLTACWIQDVDGNITLLEDYDKSCETNYYFNVENGDSFVRSTYNVTIRFCALNSEGSWEVVNEENFNKVLRRTKIKELVGEFPKVSTEYQGLNQNGWEGSCGENENTEILKNSMYTFYAVYDQPTVIVNRCYIDKNGKWTSDSKASIINPGQTYAEVLKQLKSNTEYNQEYTKLDLTSWKDNNESHYNLDAVVPTNTFFNLTAQYDSKLQRATYYYIGEDGTWKEKCIEKKIMEDPSLEDAIEELKKESEPETYNNMEFSAWENTGYHSDTFNQVLHDYEFRAVYKDTSIVDIDLMYQDENGMGMTSKKIKPMIVKKGKDTVADVIAAIPKDAVAHNSLLKFTKWTYYSDVDQTIDRGYTRLYLTAEYEKCLLRYVVDDKVAGFIGQSYNYYGSQVKDYDYVNTMVVDKGSKLSLPTEFGEYKDITWVTSSGVWIGNANATITGSTVIFGYAADKPLNPVKGIPMPETTVNEVMDAIANSPAETPVIVDMKDATVITKEILKSAKNHNVDIVLNMGDYSWTINSSDIKGSNLQDVNLYVKMDSDSIPDDIVKKLAGDNPVRQLSLAYEGDFGFVGELSVQVGTEYNGKYGCLYYYDSDGVLKYMNAGQIDSNGKVSLNFSHASDYVIVMKDNAFKKGDVDGSGKVDLKDLMLILKHVSGKTTMTEEQQKIADVTSDGKVDLKDLMLVLKFVSGKISEL